MREAMSHLKLVLSKLWQGCSGGDSDRKIQALKNVSVEFGMEASVYVVGRRRRDVVSVDLLDTHQKHFR